jgi:hypothetical protein
MIQSILNWYKITPENYAYDLIRIIGTTALMILIINLIT